jgi:hypothetical protein
VPCSAAPRTSRSLTGRQYGLFRSRAASPARECGTPSLDCCGAERSERAQREDAQIMSTKSERDKQRYAEDREFREKKLARSRTNHWKNREKINAQAREKWKSDPEFRARGCARSKETWRRTTYGLTTADYNRMLMAQNGACAICKQTSDKTLCINHCHATRKLRSLLCHKCNSALGLYADDPNRLREAAAYVEAWRDRHAGASPRTGTFVPEGCGENVGASSGPCAVPASPGLSARDAGQGIKSPLPHRPSPPPACSVASPATAIGQPASAACERRTRRPAPMSADGVFDGSEHVIVPQAGDQAGAGGLEPRQGHVDPAPMQVRNSLQQDLRSGEIDVARASAAGRSRLCGLTQVPAGQKYGRGPLIDQPTKFAAVSTIPRNSAPTQDNRSSSLRIDLICGSPVRRLPSPPRHRRP